jgi:hypothetical protein
MKTITIQPNNALKAYQNADKSGKLLLENLLGKEFISSGEITDRIKTFEDVLSSVEVSENLNILLSYNGIDPDMLGAQAMTKLTLIARALNEGWEPDWTDSNQYKYVPYFNNYKSGFGFSGSNYDAWYSGTCCGSRLCFKSAKLAEYAGKQFLDIYNQFLTTK